MEQVLADYFERLQTLHRHLGESIDGLPATALDWIPGPEMNSLAVLIVHLTGAERYWIGDVAGQEPSGRNREAEFTAGGLQAAMLQERLDDTLEHSRRVLERLTLEDLTASRVAVRDGRDCTVAWALFHALEHAGIHLGHVQLVRQLLEQHREAWYSYTVPEDE